MATLIQMVDIYRLLNSKQEIFYVGQTVDKKSRLRSHKERFGEDITMEVIATVISPYASHYEFIYIKKHHNEGCVLRNKTGFIETPKLPAKSEEYYLSKLKEKSNQYNNSYLETKSIKKPNKTTQKLNDKIEELQAEVKRLKKYNGDMASKNEIMSNQISYIETKGFYFPDIYRIEATMELVNYIKTQPIKLDRNTLLVYFKHKVTSIQVSKLSIS